jgi:hypothetical protein
MKRYELLFLKNTETSIDCPAMREGTSGTVLKLAKGAKGQGRQDFLVRQGHVARVPVSRKAASVQGSQERDF